MQTRFLQASRNAAQAVSGISILLDVCVFAIDMSTAGINEGLGVQGDVKQ